MQPWLVNYAITTINTIKTNINVFFNQSHFSLQKQQAVRVETSNNFIFRFTSITNTHELALLFHLFIFHWAELTFNILPKIPRL